MQNERKVVELDIDDVLPNRFQPRIKFNEDSINELSISIKKYGVIQPIVVRKIGNKYEIIAGERRYKASVMAGKKTIPAIISELSDKDSVEIALIENVQREDLTPIEKAVSYKKILDMGYITQEDLAEKVGKSQSAIANTLRLLNLTDEVQEALLENKISERHARSLLKLKDENKQVELLNKIIEERLTVRKTDEEIDKMLNGLNNIDMKEEKNNDVVSIPDVEDTNNFDFKLPGFMNIDEIEKNASDINISKPSANIDQLLGASGVQPNPDVEVIPYNETLQSNKFFNFFDESVEENNSNVENNVSVEIPSFEVPVAPAVEMPSFEVPAEPAVEIPSFEVPAEPAVEIPSFEIPAEPAVEIPSFEVPAESAVEIPTFEIPAEPAVDVSTSNYNSEIEILPTIEVGPIVEPFNISESVSEPTVITSDLNVTKPNLRLALDKIRECEKELQKLGFVVEMDEIDFENNYEIIFKIEK